ncbi:outer membrane protein insertion porin family [Formivibrio citricus]|uniref:Outer membrane protein assembly factor BamA n=1 Tax=Formivibrio citricus TaxID=83765 RepID=A0A1I4X9N7_9NEIS|nr:outer membrane protein assembly factor BamA [Formivibrio citricus]SFN22372.1 outer membrane protein insertion porin family [Formivibrio citricus]
MKLKPISLLLLAALGATSFPVLAIDPVTVKDIRVEGLQRTDAGTVFNYLPVKVGGRFDDDVAKDAIKALFATGFFDDVRIETEGDVLVVTVAERPTIAQININGSSFLDKDQIRAALKSQNFAEGRIFQQGVLDNAVNELKQQYFAGGRYSVNVKTTVTKLERNRIGVQFDIAEGDVARIKRINIVGNKVFAEKRLIDLFSLTTSGWMTWYTRSDQYSKQKLTADLEKLRSYYQDRGYLEFSIDSTQVSLSEDKEGIYLTVNVTEGEKFSVGEVRFAGDLVIGDTELRKLLEVKQGDVFSREKVTKSTAAISDRLGAAGFAFANVNPVPEVDKSKRLVNFTFYVDPGRKTFVRKINVSGNAVTRDEVIRREMRQMEAAPYDGAKIKRSKERLNQLDYFKEVNISTPVVPDAVDQVDININVTEKKTGNFSLGAGYGQGEGVILAASLSQANFLGSGKSVTLEGNTSKSSRTYALGVMNPYATPDGVSFGWNAYSRHTDPSVMSLGSYNTNSLGTGFSVGLPVSEENRITLTANAERININTNSDTASYINDYISRQGNVNKNFSLGASWSRDTRDSASYPTRGTYRTAGTSLTVPGSTTKFFKVSGQNQAFHTFGNWLTGVWNVEAGYAHAYAGSEVPFYSNFYVGGIGSVRGFKTGSISAKDPQYGNAMGGTRRFVNNFEFLTPMPGMKDDKSMRLSVFVDSGAAWAESEKLHLSDLRHAAGVAFTWVSPVGPIKMSVAKPIKKKSDDKTESFQFQLGQVF